MKRKYLPLIFMLVAGATVSVITLIAQYPLGKKVLILAIVLVVFYFLGSILKFVLDRFESQNEKGESSEEVIPSQENT